MSLTLNAHEVKTLTDQIASADLIQSFIVLTITLLMVFNSTSI